MRILALTKYGAHGASSRARTYLYRPALEAAGLTLTLAPFLSDRYVDGLQRGRRDGLEVLSAYLGRLKALRQAKHFDLVWMEKDALPWCPAWLERWLLTRTVPYVMDYDDAVFHLYDRHPNALVRALLGRKHDRLMRAAALITAGNDYLAQRARHSGAARVELLPTVVDLSAYRLAHAHTHVPDPRRPVEVVWIGQRSTAKHLQALAGVMRTLTDAGLCRFTAIGIDAQALGLPMRSQPWRADTEAEDLRHFDIGIMPLPDTPFERGKCGYKLIQYMACGLPVIASPVGVNQVIVRDGGNGLLAGTAEEWANALHCLAADPALRLRMGRQGRACVEQHYCLAVTAPRLIDLLRTVARPRT